MFSSAWSHKHETFLLPTHIITFPIILFPHFMFSLFSVLTNVFNQLHTLLIANNIELQKHRALFQMLQIYLTHLIFTPSLWDGYSYYPHFYSWENRDTDKGLPLEVVGLGFKLRECGTGTVLLQYNIMPHCVQIRMNVLGLKSSNSEKDENSIPRRKRYIHSWKSRKACLLKL